MRRRARRDGVLEKVSPGGASSCNGSGDVAGGPFLYCLHPAGSASSPASVAVTGMSRGVTR